MKNTFLCISLSLLLFCCPGRSSAFAVCRRPHDLERFNRRLIEAMRYGNVERMRIILRRAGAEDAIPDWLMEYNRDLLSSCGRDAILFTSGTLDTIAGWYLQQIDRYRCDITIVPAGMLSSPWFVLALAERDSIVMQCLDPGMPRIDIIEGGIPDTAPGQLPPGKSGGRAIPFDSTLNTASNFTPASISWLMHLIGKNGFRRPVHLSLLCAAKLFTRPGDEFTLAGLTYRLAEEESRCDVAATEAVLERALGRFTFDTDEYLATKEADRIIMQYAFLCKEVAAVHHEQGHYSRERDLIDTMRELADSCMILDAETYDLMLESERLTDVRKDPFK